MTPAIRDANIKTAKFSWSKVDQSEPDACWPWKGSVNRWGYGDAVHDGLRVNASRAAFIDAKGSVPDGLVVCHACDNPICCNPKHLFAATQAENLEDCRRKGRARGCPSGVAHHRFLAKLTEGEVRMARVMYASGVSQTEISRRFGVHSSTISRAVRGKNWSHVA